MESTTHCVHHGDSNCCCVVIDISLPPRLSVLFVLFAISHHLQLLVRRVQSTTDCHGVVVVIIIIIIMVCCFVACGVLCGYSRAHLFIYLQYLFLVSVVIAPFGFVMSGSSATSSSKIRVCSRPSVVIRTHCVSVVRCARAQGEYRYRYYYTTCSLKLRQQPEQRPRV